MESIKQSVLRKEKKFNLLDFHRIRRDLLLDLPLPEIRLVKGSVLKNGHKASFSVKNYPMPLVNLWEGRLDPQTKPFGMDKITVSFEGPKGPIVQKGKYNPQTNILDVDIPKEACGRALVFFMSTSQYLGPIDDYTLKKVFLDCYSVCDADYEFSGITTVGVSLVSESEIWCDRCKTDPICPHGAIKFDITGKCYVRRSVCRGIDRKEDIHCFDCFEGEEQFSTKCPSGSLGKLMQMRDQANCCGCCHEGFLTIPGVCLIALCSQGAVGSGHDCERCPGQVDTDTSNYTVDKELCNGCGVCFDNNSCPKIMMKAYIRHKPEVLHTVIITDINLEFLDAPAPEAVIEKIRKLESYFGIIPKEGEPPDPPFPIHWNLNYKAMINKDFIVGDELNFHLFFLNNNGQSIPMDFLALSNLRSSFYKIKIHKGVKSGVSKFKLNFGTLEVHYEVKSLNNPMHSGE